MESVNATAHDTTGILLINAMSRLGNYTNLIELYQPVEGVVNVELKINGNVVPIVEALEDAWGRLEKDFHKRVNEKAREMIKKAGVVQVEQIEETLDAVRRELQDRFSRELGVQFDNEDD